jgi:hypothetical protein
MTPYLDVIMGDDQCGFFTRTTDYISDTVHLPDTGEQRGVWDCTPAIHRLKKAYDGLRMEVPHSILTELLTTETSQNNKTCLNET